MLNDVFVWVEIVFLAWWLLRVNATLLTLAEQDLKTLKLVNRLALTVEDMGKLQNLHNQADIKREENSDG